MLNKVPSWQNPRNIQTSAETHNIRKPNLRAGFSHSYPAHLINLFFVWSYLKFSITENFISVQKNI